MFFVNDRESDVWDPCAPGPAGIRLLAETDSKGNVNLGYVIIRTFLDFRGRLILKRLISYLIHFKKLLLLGWHQSHISPTKFSCIRRFNVAAKKSLSIGVYEK